MPSDRVLQNCGVRRPLGGGILPAAMHSCVDRSRVVICDLALSNGHKWALVHIPRNVLVMYQGSKLFTYLGQWPYKVWDYTSKNCFNLDRGPCWVCGVTLSILWDSTHSASHKTEWHPCNPHCYELLLVNILLTQHKKQLLELFVVFLHQSMSSRL